MRTRHPISMLECRFIIRADTAQIPSGYVMLVFGSLLDLYIVEPRPRHDGNCAHRSRDPLVRSVLSQFSRCKNWKHNPYHAFTGFVHDGS
jgi:hypothetical protein